MLADWTAVAWFAVIAIGVIGVLTVVAVIIWFILVITFVYEVDKESPQPAAPRHRRRGK